MGTNHGEEKPEILKKKDTPPIFHHPQTKMGDFDGVINWEDKKNYFSGIKNKLYKHGTKRSFLCFLSEKKTPKAAEIRIPDR